MNQTFASPLWARFYDVNPYEDFPLEDHPEDLQGWGSQHAVFEHLIRLVRPSLIAEVGSWKGRSALHMAAIAQRLDLSVEILCIDTWLGAPEHILRRDYFESLRMKNGYPQLFHTFVGNVIRAGRQEVITPLPQTSENAAVLMAHMDIKPQLIYIDAAHEYEPVFRDLQAYWPLLDENGYLFGDDYPNAHGVVRAVHEFAELNHLDIVVGNGKFVLLREPDASFEEIGMGPPDVSDTD